MMQRTGERQGGTTLHAVLPTWSRRPGLSRAHRATRSADLAREATAPFSLDAPPAGTGCSVERVPEVVVGGLRSAVDALASLDLDAYDDRQFDDIIRGTQRQLDRLTSARDRMVAARHRRRVLAAGPGRETAAARDSDRQLADELGFTPGEAKRTRDAGRQLLARPELASAVDEGRLRPDQARVIGNTLREAPPESHDTLTDDLLEAAASQNATSLGATARRRLTELDQDAAVDAGRRRHAVIVTVDLEDLARRRGVGEGRWTGPIPVTELERFATTATAGSSGSTSAGCRSPSHGRPTTSRPVSTSRSPTAMAGAATPAVTRQPRGATSPTRSPGGTGAGSTSATACCRCRRHHRLIDEGGWTITVDRWNASFTHASGRVLRAGRACGQPGTRGTDPPT